MPSKAEQVRALIYGEPLDQLPPGFPSKRDCMRFFMKCVQEQRVAENNAIRLNDTSKTKIRDDFVTQLEVHWSNQSPKKTLMITRDINREVKPLIDFYWKLQDLGAAKLEDPGWINDRREELECVLDIEEKTEKTVSKKRSIQEVRNHQDSKCVTSQRLLTLSKTSKKLLSLVRK